MDLIEIEPDVVEIGDLDIPEIKIDNNFIDEEDNTINNKPSINFGGGIELLMNDKNKEQKKENSSIEIEDITKLEDELNDLTDNIDSSDIQSKTIKKSSNIFGGLFGKKEDGDNIKSINEIKKEDNLGKSTSNLNETKTSDGYGKFNNIPLSMEKTQEKKN